ncbi:MAG: ABC transporter permease [Bryobacteraceae bacterium]
MRDQQRGLAGVAAWGDTGVNLAPRGEVRSAEGLWVSGRFFPLLGVRPAVGRLFTPEDDRRGCGNPGVVISHSFWQREFGGSPDVLSKTLAVGEQNAPVPVIGVTPPEFFGVEVGRRFDIAMPVCAADNLDNREFFFLSVLGRRHTGWSIERTRAHLAAISPGVFEAATPPRYRPDDAKRFRALRLDAQPGAAGVSALRTSFAKPLWILLAIVGAVLLIACGNITNLMLARATAREQEFAVRLSIGASRARLIRQLLTESLILAGAGAIAGILLSGVLARSFVSMLGTTIFLDLSADWRVLGFTAAIACGACVLFGLAPAFRAGRASQTIRQVGRGLTAGREQFTTRRLLLASQVALCMVLLVAALLFIRSFEKLLTVDKGFRHEGVLIANTSLPARQYPVERRHAIHRALLARLRAIPGVSVAAHAYLTPISASAMDLPVRTRYAQSGERESVYLNRVSDGYFRAMGIGLLSGRDFNDRDTPSSPRVAIVNEAFMRRYFAGNAAVGEIFRMPGSASQPDDIYQIVGVVKNSKYRSVQEAFPPIAYLAASQLELRNVVRYLLHTSGRAEDLTAAVKRVFAEYVPDASVRFTVLQTQIEESLLRERLMAALSALFGVLATLMAVVGLYGVFSYMVARRQNEIGIRMALGADRASVLRMILGEAGILLTAGLTVGLLTSLAAGRAAKTLLYGIESHDPLTLSIAGLILGVAGLAASFLPAHRASSLDPVNTLRQQ